MSTIFFKISPTQEREVKRMMAKEGYESKAEFFRFLLKFYKYNRLSEEERFKQSAKGLSEALDRLDAQGLLNKTPEEQLADV